MKSYGMILVILIWGAGTIGIGFAQTKPVSSSYSAHSSGLAGKFNSNIHAVNLQLRQQMRQVRMDVKLGKLTQAQAKDVWERLKSVRVQELQFFKQNGQHEVTADQKNQLNQILAQTAQSI
jgi:hypothetical protein